MATDLLSDILADLRADAVVTGRFTLSAPWAIRKPAVSGAPFRMCTGSPFYLIVEGEPPVYVKPGDFVLLPHGDEHIMASSLDVRPVPFDSLMADKGIHPRFDTPLEFTAGGGGATSELYTGIVVYRDIMRSPLFSVLQTLIHVRADDPAVAPWLVSTLQSFIQESMTCQPGWEIAASRLSDVLFVQLLRAHLQSTANHSGWLRGLADPQIGRAVALIHREPRRDWSVASLAAAAGMSRSRFSARFMEVVGDTPIGHLTAYRMYLASGELTRGRRTLIEIAEKVGYTSEKAFARAFHRWSGMAPRRYARNAHALDDLAKRG
ncbi:AraC family transcriptional regulator [Paraburkholderia panacisoli]|uniref:AraC family transcriptional regulator n=1 Tax=Paraburkholderia panacisoli TaxID=2603818 RepID=A0A5B0GVM3_9BURK|nr:AraC family transcriptional regulator [Paraburkholderia panacisoli]KAA1006862.1 AraC family transcriptional regulator [Paraburkholderia panacisoli]